MGPFPDSGVWPIWRVSLILSAFPPSLDPLLGPHLMSRQVWQLVNSLSGQPCI